MPVKQQNRPEQSSFPSQKKTGEFSQFIKSVHVRLPLISQHDSSPLLHVIPPQLTPNSPKPELELEPLEFEPLELELLELVPGSPLEVELELELEVELEITSPLELALTSPLELEPPIPPVVDDVLDEAGAPPAPPELPATGGSYVHAPRTTPAITPVTTTGLNLFFRYIGVLHAKQASP